MGGFAKCFELIDAKTGKIYAGKVIAKSQLVKPDQKDKVSHIYILQTLNPFVSKLKPMF
jgi:polo-like kinase 1